VVALPSGLTPSCDHEEGVTVLVLLITSSLYGRAVVAP